MTAKDLQMEIFYLQTTLSKERQGWPRSEAARAISTLNECHKHVSELLFLLETVIPDLRAEASGYRPVSWRENCTDQDMLDVFLEDFPHEPATLRQLRHSMLRRGFDLTYDYIAGCINGLIRAGKARVHSSEGYMQNHSAELLHANRH